MAFSEFELVKIDKIVGGFCRQKIPLEIRNQVRMEYSINSHDVEIFEVRPRWDNPQEEMQTPVAKIKLVRTAKEWRLFWMRQDLKWHRYEPLQSSRDLKEIVDEIDQDRQGCFFG